MAKYRITTEQGKVFIKIGNKRLPIEEYQHIRDNPVELSQFVNRKNEKLNTIERIEIKHAFISPALRDKFETFLKIQISNKIMAKCYYGYVDRYFLNYFINIEKLNNPEDWHRSHKTGWAQYLLDLKLAPSTIKQIVYASNKFMRWLHDEKPDIPVLKFEPISPARFKEAKASRKINKEERETHFIPDEDWAEIVTSASKELSPVANLCYHLGLRRSEAMGMKPSDVKKGCVLIERQLLKLGKYGPVKGRLARKVPYWFTTPEQVYNWIDQMLTIHPRTLSELWENHIKTLVKKNKIKINYTLHDLRHTWITKAIRKYVPRDVQLAAGHVNIQTTMGYVHDDRSLDDEEFKPVA